MRATTFDLQPRLVGELVELRPLHPDDWEALFAVARDPLIWEQHPAKERSTEAGFREFFRKALDEVNNAGGALAVIERSSGKIIGSTRYHGYNPEKSEVEIGWTFLARSHWGGRYNGEMKRLMLQHAFGFVDTVFFLVGPGNIRSQTAMQRIGATRTGIIQQRDANGKMVDHVRFEIRKAAFLSDQQP